MPKQAPYHHGHLKLDVLEQAAVLVAESGPDVLSLRDLARRAGVSHAAPAHHFGDRRGLFTELAIIGFNLLAARLGEAGTDFKAVAVAYVQFALSNPGHYAVMFRRDLVNDTDDHLISARLSAGQSLATGVAQLSPIRLHGSDESARLAAWSLVHGFASLWLDGVIPGLRENGNPVQLTVEIADQLFG